MDDPRPELQDRLDLADRLVEIDERHRRHGEDPMAVVEAPGVVDPAVERAQVRDAGGRVVAQLPFHAEAEARPHHDRLDLLLVHPFEAGLAVVEARDLPRLNHVGVGERSVARVLVGDDGTGAADAVDGRHLEVVGGVAADPRLSATRRVALDVNGAVGEGRVEEAREGVVGLVIVVVGVDEAIGKAGAFGLHGISCAKRRRR
ncbi:MAG: hypothetical protein IPK00_04935 [Deltaproteobacteria bacterium]|nr:hypothetical protein [Deltaproteobacteria bacterium]